MPISDEERKKQRDKLRQRSTGAYEERIAEKNRELIAAETAVMAPPMVTIPQCHVCMSERRLWIEKLLLQGLSYSAISRHLANAGEDIDRRSVSKHSKEHMNVKDAVVRATMEKEAELIGQQYDEGVDGAFTQMGALKTLFRKGWEDAMNEVTTVEVRDLVQLSKNIREMEVGEGTAVAENAKIQLNIFVEALQNVTTEWFDGEEAQRFQMQMVKEIKRLRSRDEVDIEVEKSLKELPNGNV